MTIEEAIKTAITYEKKVESTYGVAVKESHDPIGQRVFSVLAKEEKSHVAYLESQLKCLKESGKLHHEKLATAIPSQKKIAEGFKKLQATMKEPKELSSLELGLLQKALGVEQETSSFYKRMVSELSEEGQRFFARFVEIEEGHVAIVQAEMDAVSGLGFWFDMQEFRLEAG